MIRRLLDGDDTGGWLEVEQHRRSRRAGPTVLAAAVGGSDTGPLPGTQDEGDPEAAHGHQQQAPAAVHGPALAEPGWQWRQVRGHGLPEQLGGHPGAQGILVDYTGGTIGASLTGTPDAHARTFLAQIEPVFPGISRKWNGKVTLDFWTAHPYTLGSYSYWKVGQYTAFSGVEGEAVGTCHFAGEHTSQDFQGYLNGAVETGYRAAAEILAARK